MRQVHFFEYGLAGILFLRALIEHLGYNWKSMGLAFLFASGAGWGDECLQGITPGRHHDLHDIVLNAAAASLGLLIYAALYSEKKKGSLHG